MMAFDVALNDRVVIDGDVARLIGHAAAAIRPLPTAAIDAVEEIVPHDDRVGLPARVVRVDAENRNAGRHVADDVLLELDVLDLAPWTAPSWLRTVNSIA